MAGRDHNDEMMLGMLGHVLRTPLNAIIGYAEMLLEDAHDEGNVQVAEDLARIRRAGKRLHRLVNAAVTLSKLNNGDIELAVDEFDARELADETSRRWAADFGTAEQSLQVSGDGARLRADRARLGEVLVLTVEYLNEAMHQRVIHLHVAERDDRVCFEVRGSVLSGSTPRASETRRITSSLDVASWLARAIGGDLREHSGEDPAIVLEIPAT